MDENLSARLGQISPTSFTATYMMIQGNSKVRAALWLPIEATILPPICTTCDDGTCPFDCFHEYSFCSKPTLTVRLAINGRCLFDTHLAVSHKTERALPPAG